TGGFLKFVGEELTDLKRHDLAMIKADLLRLKRRILTENLEEFKVSQDAAVKKAKAKAEQDLISRGLANTTVRQSTLPAIDNARGNELEKAAHDYNRTIEELALMERKLGVQMSCRGGGSFLAGPGDQLWLPQEETRQASADA